MIPDRLIRIVSTSGLPSRHPAVDLAVTVTILLLLALAVHAVLGRRRALIRSGLWNGVLLASLLLPVAAFGFPRVRIACLPAPAASPRETGRDVGRAAAESPGLHSVGSSVIDGNLARPVARPGGSVRTDLRQPGATPRLSALASAFVSIYVVGVLVLGLRLVSSLVAVSRLKRTASAVEEPCWTEPLARWRGQLRLNRPVSLIRSGRVRVPLVLGWLRPAVVLPDVEDDAAPPPASRIDAVLVHELVHLRRGDDYWNLVQQIVQIVYWPHPLIWLAARLIADVREQACDDYCVRWAGGAQGYRSALVAVASRLVRGPIRPIPTSLGLAMARRSSSALAHRLSWIERTRGAAACRLNGPGRAAIGLLVVGTACVLSTVELARVRASQADGTTAPGAPARAYRDSLRAAAKFHTVTLTVLDDETGKPLSDVEVTVVNYVEVMDYRFLTDSSGQIICKYPYMGDVPELALEIRKNGFVPLRISRGGLGEPTKWPVDALTFRLRRGITMGGVVVYAGDRPVEGVTVVMTVNKYGSGKRPKNPTGPEGYYEVPSKTGPDGRWRTDSVPPGAERVSLQLIHPDFVTEGSTTAGHAGRSPKIADLLAQTDRQVLKKGARITGRVIDEDGEPLKGVRVVDSTHGMTFVDYVREAFTDDGGWFHLHFGRDEKIRLTAELRGYAAVSREFKPEPDTPPLEFHLKKSRGLRGQIVDPAGKPVAGAGISLFGFPPRRETNFLAYADSEGRFEWDSAPETAAYSAWAEGFAVTETALAAGGKEAVVVLKPTFDLRFRVVDAETGKPLDGFWVELGKTVPGVDGVQWENPVGKNDGDYSVSRALMGASYQFKISADGYTPAQTRSYRDDERVIREVIKLGKEAK